MPSAGGRCVQALKASLPDGWFEHEDEAQDRVYYHDTATGQVKHVLIHPRGIQHLIHACGGLELVDWLMGAEQQRDGGGRGRGGRRERENI